MPIKHDELNGVSLGEIYCRPHGQPRYTKCLMVLNRPNQTLTCYHSDQSMAAKDQILIELQTDSIALVETARKEKQQYCFAVHCLAKVTYFYAQSWKEMDDWIHMIKESSQIKVSKAHLNPDRVSVMGSYRTEIIGGKVIHVPTQEKALDQQGVSFYKVSSERKDSSSSSSQSSAPTDTLGSNQYGFIKTGYCVKMGRVRKNWKRRFLGVNDTQLMYFKHESEKKPLKIIEVSCIKDVKVSESDIPRENLIDVVTPYRTFYMQFDTNNDMRSWIQELRRLAGLTVMTYI